KAAAGGQVADVHTEGLGRIADIDVPVVAAAVDFDVAEDGLGGAGRVLATHIKQAENRLGRVPLLAERGFGAADGVPRQLPVGVQPIRIADHDDDAVFAIAGRQVAR